MKSHSDKVAADAAASSASAINGTYVPKPYVDTTNGIGGITEIYKNGRRNFM